VRAGLEVFARRWWGGELGTPGRLLSVVALPLSWGWTAGSALSSRRAERAATRVEGLCVISVGNLAVGGTGKTPLAGWIAAMLCEAGAAPAVLVGPPPAGGGGGGGDEALLHRRRLADVPVFQGRDRTGSARRALAGGARVAVLDDGFQHRRLRRDLDVVLLSAEDRFPGPVLPRGPYREQEGALARADLVVVTRRAAGLERSRELAARVASVLPERAGPAVVAGVELAADSWTDLNGRPVAPPVGDVVAACAVARPRAFRSAVARVVTGSVELVAFADHHAYTPADAARLRKRAGGRPIVITEKDAVTLHGLAGILDPVRVLAETLRWDWGEADLRARLLEAAQGVRA